MTYGIGTHSFLNSTEHRQTKKERAEFTDAFERGEVKLEFAEPPLLCHCRSFAYPHLPEAHRKLRSDLDWRTPEERNSEYREDCL